MYGTDGWWLIAIILLTAGSWLAYSRWAGRRPTPTLVVQLTNHAKQRMTEREVNRQQIEFVVAAPERELRDAKNNSVRLEREINGKTLIVWVAEPWPAAQPAVVKSTAWADVTDRFVIPPAKAGLVIGQGGSTIRRIESESGARISIDRSGSVRISSPTITSAQSAKEQILAIVRGDDTRAVRPLAV